MSRRSPTLHSVYSSSRSPSRKDPSSSRGVISYHSPPHSNKPSFRGAESSLVFDRNELKRIQVCVNRTWKAASPPPPVVINRSVTSPEDVVIVRRPGEGSRPIFSSDNLGIQRVSPVEQGRTISISDEHDSDDVEFDKPSRNSHNQISPPMAFTNGYSSILDKSKHHTPVERYRSPSPLPRSHRSYNYSPKREPRSRDREYRLKDREHGSKDREYRSKDRDHRSKDRGRSKDDVYNRRKSPDSDHRNDVEKRHSSDRKHASRSSRDKGNTHRNKDRLDDRKRDDDKDRRRDNRDNRYQPHGDRYKHSDRYHRDDRSQRDDKYHERDDKYHRDYKRKEPYSQHQSVDHNRIKQRRNDRDFSEEKGKPLREYRINKINTIENEPAPEPSQNDYNTNSEPYYTGCENGRAQSGNREFNVPVLVPHSLPPTTFISAMPRPIFAPMPQPMPGPLPGQLPGPIPGPMPPGLAPPFPPPPFLARFRPQMRPFHPPPPRFFHHPPMF